MEFDNRGIKCSQFLDTQAVIEKTVTKIKEVRSTKERQYYAQDILIEAEFLLSCQDYKPTNQDCHNCHFICHRYNHGYEYLAKNERRRKSHV